MSYLIDTCTLSELVTSKPEQRVVHWFYATAPHLLFVSVLTFGEIRRGVERSTAGRRRERIRVWLET